MIEAPTPILPRGAGGLLRRAAGWVSEEPLPGAPDDSSLATVPEAIVLEPDPLMQLLVAEAVTALGFGVRTGTRPSVAVEPAAVFVSLDDADGCRFCRPARRSVVRADLGDPARVDLEEPVRCAGGALVVGYGAGPSESLAIHRLHRCGDLVMALRAVAGRPRLVHVPAGGMGERAGVTAREADVLVLLLAGQTTASIASRLGVAPSTARSHCRALLRKLGAGDRRALRARFFAGHDRPIRTGGRPLQRSYPEVCLAVDANFAQQ